MGSSEHNGHLPVHIGLRKGASCLPARSREIHLNVFFLHFVTQQEDLIPTKAAPRVPVYSADLELGSVGGTVIKNRMREDRGQAEGLPDGSRTVTWKQRRTAFKS